MATATPPRPEGPAARIDAEVHRLARLLERARRELSGRWRPVRAA